MRITLDIDAELLERARELTGIHETATLVRTALEALIAREATRNLIAFGGTQPDIADIPRCRPSLD